MRNQAQHIFRGTGDDGDHDDAERHATSQTGEGMGRNDNQGPGKQAKDDRWHACEYPLQESDESREAPSSNLGEVDPCEDSQWHPDKRAAPAEKHRPHNSFCHPPTRLSIGGRQLREKGKIQIGQPLAQHIEQQVQQDDHRKPSTGESEHDGKPIGKLPAYAVCRARCLERMRNSTHERLLPARLVPPILAISTRARMLVSKVMTKTRSPASRSAEMKSPGVASPN